MRSLAVLLALIAVPLALPSPGPATAATAVPGLPAGLVDEAWLADADAFYAALPGFADVGYAAAPDVHVAVLFHGEPPADVPALHPALATRAYSTSAFEPVSHDALVPFMHLLAQQVPHGIRPGAWTTAPWACTMAHVARDAAGKTFIMTAGHCVDRVGQRVALEGEGEIGSVVAFRNGGYGEDFALVSVDDSKLHRVDASMIGWKGPVGVATEPGLEAVKHYGWGALTWQAHATRCREGVTAPTYWGVRGFGFNGVVIWGDSGSAANTGDGRALGIITHLSLNPLMGNNYGTRATYALDQLERMTGLDLSIVNGEPVRDTCEVL